MNAINSLPEWFVYLFLFVGVGTAVVVVIFSIIEIIENIQAKISVRVYAYKVKHRFDKTPIAKCYCRDCEYWQVRDNFVSSFQTGECRIFNRYNEDYCFCYYATPRKKNPDSQ